MIETAVGLGVLLNLILIETIGLSAGGMVVPGYLALFWDQPPRIVSTFALAVLTWVLVARVLRRWILLYGRRRYAAMLLVGMGLTWLVHTAAPALMPYTADWRAIGFLLPGLMGNEMEHQGVIPTIVVTAGLAAAVRLALVFFSGWPSL